MSESIQDGANLRKHQFSTVTGKENSDRRRVFDITGNRLAAVYFGGLQWDRNADFEAGESHRGSHSKQSVL